METSWIFQYPTWKTVKGFSGRPIGIPSDVRSASDDFIWSEICGDGKRFNSVSTYYDDGNVANEDGYQKRCDYSNKIEASSLNLFVNLFLNSQRFKESPHLRWTLELRYFMLLFYQLFSLSQEPKIISYSVSLSSFNFWNSVPCLF